MPVSGAKLIEFKLLNKNPFFFLISFRALQIPPEAWLRISLNHASMTWISIHPSGRVTLRSLGESGHIPPESVTSR